MDEIAKMSVEYQSPVIVCGSGPSLARVPLLEPGFPLCAVSTALRFIKRPQIWIAADRPNKNHGTAADRDAVLDDPDIIKVFSGRVRSSSVSAPKNIHYVARTDARNSKKYNLFNWPPGGLYLRGLNQSITMAVQWLIRDGGFQTLIFAGVDLGHHNGYYVHNQPVLPNSARRKQAAYNNVNETLRSWTRIAANNGVAFLSWTPGSRINEYMEPFIWNSIKSES